MEKVNFGSEKLKNAWEYVKFGFEKDHDGKHGFSWPQRNYRCSFCKREFKSAQALGGHMNVHRRERAKMRLLHLGDHYIKPKPIPNLNPNPKSFPSSSASSAAKFLPSNNIYQSSYHNGFSAPSTAADGEKVPILIVRSPATPPGKLFSEVRDLQFLTKANDSILRMKKEIVRVNGLNVSSFLRDAKDDLDLELRLGHY